LAKRLLARRFCRRSIRHPKGVFGSIVVVSTGVLEDVFGQCLHEMREAISKL
jgi:hypothetical protein